MKTILVPVDFSAVTDRVVSEALALARLMEGRLVLLNVTEPVVGMVDYAVVSMTIASASDAMIKRARERLDALQQHWKIHYPHVETAHLIGSPAREILAHAARLPADYLVMGSHGHGMVYDVLVGSTTHGVLKTAPCPVVIVPASMAQRTAAPAAETEVTI